MVSGDLGGESGVYPPVWAAICLLFVSDTIQYKSPSESSLPPERYSTLLYSNPLSQLPSPFPSLPPNPSSSPSHSLSGFSSAPRPALKFASRSWFRFPRIRSVFCRSNSVISCQLPMREMVPSRPTTIGPRLSRATACPLTCTVFVPSLGFEVEELESGEGRPGRAGSGLAGDSGC